MIDIISNFLKKVPQKTKIAVTISGIVIFMLFIFLLPNPTAKILTILKDILVSLAAIFTVYVAKEGLISWKKELSGKANFEVARNIARATYKLRDELQYCRSPWIPLSEFPEGYDPTNRTSQSEADAYYHIHSNRWKPVAEALQAFEVEALEAEVLWGSEFKTLTDELRQCCRNLQVAMEAFISNKANDNEDFKGDPEFGKQVKETIMAINIENNPLTKKIENAVNSLETNVKPHLKDS